MAERKGSTWLVAVIVVAVVGAAALVPVLYENVLKKDGAGETAEAPSAGAESASAQGTSDASATAGDEAADAAAEEADKTSVAYITGERIINADEEPGNWLSYGRTYDEQRYSPLDKINAENVKNLSPAWVWHTGTTRGLESTPIVVDGMMFFTLTWGVTVALDAKTGEEIWTFDPEVPGEWGRYGCCDVVNRGPAVWKGKVYTASFDGRLFALDAKTGEKVWEVNTVPGAPYTSTGAPRIVKDKVVIGNGGGEYGVRGFFTAYDAETGDQVWRFYTVPGNPADPIENPELEAAMPTWKGGEWWKVGGGGTVWDSMAYDPELDLMYIGTGNGSPWTREIRSPGGGDNLYLSSILAIDPDTGRMKWYYQETPGDNWDYTATQHIMLADIEIDGKMRKVLMQAPKNGFFYVLDRETGELISANNYVATTWATHVDLETGRPVETPEANYNNQAQVLMPSANGGHNWHPMAFSKDTGLVYIPAQDIPGIYTLQQEWKEKHEFTVNENWWNTGLNMREYVEIAEDFVTAPVPNGYLKAWDPATGKVAWEVEYQAPLNGGLLATAGNLVFQGTATGWFYAYKADTGERVFEKEIQTGIVAPPITYEIDGEQYIALLAGWGGVNIVSGDARVSAAAKYGNHGRMIVFKLGGEEELEQLAALDRTIPDWPEVTATDAELEMGEDQYARICMFCHGAFAVSPGVVPDLRMMNEATREHFHDIVVDGMLKDTGMASFGDLLTPEQVDAILLYINKRALEDKRLEAPSQ